MFRRCVIQVLLAVVSVLNALAIWTFHSTPLAALGISDSSIR